MLTRWLEEAIDGLFHEAVDLASLLFLDVDDFWESLKMERRDEILHAVRALYLAGFGLAGHPHCNKETVRTGVALVDSEIRSRRMPAYEAHFTGLAN